MTKINNEKDLKLIPIRGEIPGFLFQHFQNSKDEFELFSSKTSAKIRENIISNYMAKHYSKKTNIFFVSPKSENLK